MTSDEEILSEAMMESTVFNKMKKAIKLAREDEAKKYQSPEFTLQSNALTKPLLLKGKADESSARDTQALLEKRKQDELEFMKDLRATYPPMAKLSMIDERIKSLETSEGKL